MPASLNKIMLIGHVGRDPETKATGEGKSFSRFSIATTEIWKDSGGDKKEKTEWHNCTVWGKLSEVVEKYVRKGSSIYVEGKMEYRETKDDKGNRQFFAGVRVETLVLLGDRKKEGGEGSEPRTKPSTKPSPKANDGGYDDDIPF